MYKERLKKLFLLGEIDVDELFNHLTVAGARDVLIRYDYAEMKQKGEDSDNEICHILSVQYEPTKNANTDISGLSRSTVYKIVKKRFI